MAESGLSNIRRAFSHREFRLYQLGRFSSFITTWMYRVAIGWMVWDMTHAATWLGIFGFLDQAPALLMTPFAGALADRLNGLKVMRVTQAILLLQAIGLCLMIEFDLITIWSLAVFVVTFGVVYTLQQPMNQTIVPNLVPRGDLVTCYGINSLLFNLSRFVGPMLAGYMIEVWNPGVVILCNALGAAGFSLGLALMKPFAPMRKARDNKSSLIEDIREGFSYAIRHEGVRPMFAIVAVISVFPYSISLLLPGLADGVFHQGPSGLAWMTSVLGGGAILMGVYLAQRGGIVGLTSDLVSALLVGGFAFIALSLAPQFWMTLPCIAVIGVATMGSRTGSMTLLQYSVDASMRGRVSGLYTQTYMVGPAVGSLILGFFGDLFGLRLMMAVIGFATLALWVWAFSRRKRIAAALEIEPAAEAASPAGAAPLRAKPRAGAERAPE